MQDQLNHNPLAITGTPSLVTGALTVDTDQGLAFNGTTNSASAADSASLSITGSLSIEFFVRLPSLPGSSKNIILKNNSYSVDVDSTGHIMFTVVGGFSNTITSNVALSTNRWYHIVCVYNGNYAGAQQFGKNTLGATSLGLADDNGNNKLVSKFTLVETALLNNVNLLLSYPDEIWYVQMTGVVYSDNAGVPDALVASSPMSLLYPPTPAHKSYSWVTLPLSAAVPAGDYHIGCISDTVGPAGKVAMFISRDTTGGVTSSRGDSVSGPSNPFGTVASTTTDQLSAYCNYTAVARTGNEGKMLIYIDGARNISSSYSAGVADTANALQVCPSLAAQVDEISIWNKALSPVQIATHYNAH